MPPSEHDVPRARRVRTPEEKAERRAALVTAAEAMLREQGIERFSMGALAKRVGLAKGTVYLSYGTREALLLAVHNRQLRGWGERLIAESAGGDDDAAFVRAYYTATVADPLFVELTARLGTVLEQNVSEARLVEAKRESLATLERIVAHLAPRLELPTDAAMRVLLGFGALALGAALMDAGPRLGDGVSPEIRALQAAFDAEALFTEHARPLLRAARADAG